MYPKSSLEYTRFLAKIQKCIRLQGILGTSVRLTDDCGHNLGPVLEEDMVIGVPVHQLPISGFTWNKDPDPVEPFSYIDFKFNTKTVIPETDHILDLDVNAGITRRFD